MNCKPVPTAEPPPIDVFSTSPPELICSVPPGLMVTRPETMPPPTTSSVPPADTIYDVPLGTLRRDGARRGAGNHNSRHATASFAVRSAGVAWVDPWELEQAASRFAAVRLDARQRGGPPPRTVTLMTSPYRRSTPSLFARLPARFCKAEWSDDEGGGAQPVPDFGRLVSPRDVGASDIKPKARKPACRVPERLQTFAGCGRGATASVTLKSSNRRFRGPQREVVESD